MIAYIAKWFRDQREYGRERAMLAAEERMCRSESRMLMWQKLSDELTMLKRLAETTPTTKMAHLLPEIFALEETLSGPASVLEKYNAARSVRLRLEEMA